jgi:glucosamine--fructose-6-phosphate aminotransferase (isomerizing)
MCGIVGAIAQRDITQILVEGLKRLEYRGYDSAGIALIDQQKELVRGRVKGKVHDLEQLLQHKPLIGNIGLAHTRWATHGVPSEVNAHPHISHDEIALVHNGIIENHEELRLKLLEQGYQFVSQTDSEIVVHLLHFYLHQQNSFLVAVQKTVAELKGAFALGIIYLKDPERLIAVRYGSPLVIGLGVGETFFASDSLALLPVTQQFIYLEEGDIADITRDKVKVVNKEGREVKRKIHHSDVTLGSVDRSGYRHFMLKEIFEQSRVIQDTLEERLTKSKVLEASFGHQANQIFSKVERILVVACGTSYHAGMVARHWLEEWAHIPTQVEIASEYRYRKMVVQQNTLFIVISQSGETADTLAALKLAKSQGFIGTLAICNVPESSIAREADLMMMTRAGIEIGVASTKAFTTQLAVLLLLTITLAKKNTLSAETEAQLVSELLQLSNHVESVLQRNEAIATLAERFADKEHALFLGRGIQYPIALEGALKLKEISYIHAEAYPAGELKHGPLALVDKNMPVIAVAPSDELLEKLKSNLEEVRARGGKLIVLTDESAKMQQHEGVDIIMMPKVHKILAPFIYTIPLQLLAYYVAVIKGTDVDQPRNLAKSVTVE